MKILLSIFVWIAIGILTLAVFVTDVFLLILMPFDKKRKAQHAQGFWWADSIVKLNPYWHVDVRGSENADKDAAYVIVSNHQSMADIIVAYTTHLQFKWVSKQNIFKIPFFGWCLSMSKYIQLERGNMSSIKKVYIQASDWLKHGISVFFFPEGTRSPDGRLQDFMNGAFKLAIKDKKPVLPIAIKGTTNALPKGGWIFKTKVSGSITVLPPIDVSDFGTGDFEKLKKLAHERISDSLKE